MENPEWPQKALYMQGGGRNLMQDVTNDIGEKIVFFRKDIFKSFQA